MIGEKNYSEMSRKERISYLLQRVRMDKETIKTLKAQEKAKWVE